MYQYKNKSKLKLQTSGVTQYLKYCQRYAFEYNNFSQHIFDTTVMPSNTFYNARGF